MADRLPSFGVKPRDYSKPKRMLYTQPTWTLPTGGKDMDDLTYALRVGKITQEQHDAARAKERESTSVEPRQRTAMLSPAKRKSLAQSIAARHGEEI